MRIDDIIETIAPTRLHKAWKARLKGSNTEDIGNDKNQATERLIEQIRRNARNMNQRTYRIAKDGTVFCLYWAFDCWCYDIVHKLNYRMPSSCHLSVTTYSEALERMEEHVNQYP